MTQRFARGIAAGGLAAVVFGGALWARADQDALTGLLQGGRYREAYETATQDADPATAIGRAARTLLAVSMSSNDSYQRWFALRAAQPLKDAALAESARRLAGAADRYEQSLALEILANADPHGSRQQFLTALGSAFRSVRVRALRGLAELKDRTLVARFAEVLHSDPDPDLRGLAARALAAMGTPDAGPPLYVGLDDPVPMVQEEAVRGLVALGDPGVAGLIQRRLAESRPEHRLAIIRLAELIPDRALVGALGPLMADEDGQVRAFAAAAVLSILEHTERGQR